MGMTCQEGKKEKQSIDCFSSTHIGKPLHGLCKALNGLVRVPVLDPVPDTVLDVALQDHLSAAVERGFRGVDLGQHILARHVLVHHAVDGLYLSDDLFQAAVQVFRIHTLLHVHDLHTYRGIKSIILPPHGAVNARPLCARALRLRAVRQRETAGQNVLPQDAQRLWAQPAKV